MLAGSVMVVDKGGGAKCDRGKPKISMVPLDAVAEIAKVMEFGATKYGVDNWKNVDVVRYQDALLRHMMAIQNGEEFDVDSDLSHEAHLACNAIFILWKQLHKEEQTYE